MCPGERTDSSSRIEQGPIQRLKKHNGSLLNDLGQKLKSNSKEQRLSLQQIIIEQLEICMQNIKEDTLQKI